MRLISVRAILGIEPEDLEEEILHDFGEDEIAHRHGIEPEGLEEEIFREFGEDEIAHRYGILSHCWGKADEEVTLKDMEDLRKLDDEARHCIQQRPGYRKIIETCKQAKKDRLEWVWVDTCCINKDSSAELSEAINSMYRWYENAGICYAYLHDVGETDLPSIQDEDRFKDTDGWPKWFSRGWTLQELIAPKVVRFLNAEWQPLYDGTKSRLAVVLSRITGVPVPILRYGLDADQPSTAQIMSWAAKRKTTRVEDRAYSLMGLFGVYMPMLYGEGRNAFRRLQLEIIRMTNDHSIFAWRYPGCSSSVLADDPSCFEGCDDVVSMEVEDYHRLITKDIPEDKVPVDRLRTYSVTNRGIQIWLPIRQFGDSNFFEATFACHRNGKPIEIYLVHVRSQYHSWNGSGPGGVPGPFRLQELFLAYDWKARQDHAVFRVDDSIVSRRGFVQEDIHPLQRATRSDISIPDNDHLVMSYFNPRMNTRFAVVLGSFAGQAWAHLTVPPRGFTDEVDASIIWGNMRCAGIKQAQAIVNLGKNGRDYCHIKHLHLLRSIADIRLTFQPFPQPNSYSITLDILQCTGYCISNDRWQSFDTPFPHEGCMLNSVRTIYDKYSFDWFLVDGIPTKFAQTPMQGLELGDYGHWDENDNRFEREGNIFTELPPTPFSHKPSPVKHEIRYHTDPYNEVNHIKIGGSEVCHPQCLSLSDDGRITKLLKALSTRLKGKCLITTVIQSSEISNFENFWDSQEEINITTSVPLFISTRPLLWYREGACEVTRKYIQKIRQQFDVSFNASNHRPTDVQAAVNFLSTLFAVECLRDYFGEIENFFFQWITTVHFDQTEEYQIMESDNRTQRQSSEASCDEALSQVGVKCRHSRIESLAKRLVQRMPITADGSIDVYLRDQCRRNAEEFARRTVSKPFGPQMLRLIATVYERSRRSDLPSPTSMERTLDSDEGCQSDQEKKGKNCMDYSSIKSLLQEIATLETQLNLCEGEDEQLALEEDITGKILLICYRGVRAELLQVLIKLVNLVIHDEDVDNSVQDARAEILVDLGTRLRSVANEASLESLDHLRRITDDALAGTSKYTLLLASRQHSRDMASSSKTPEKATKPTVMSRALQGAASSGTASTDTMLVVDSSTIQVGMKRSREEETDVYEGDRPLNRSRTDDHTPLDQDTLNP